MSVAHKVCVNSLRSQLDSERKIVEEASDTSLLSYFHWGEFQQDMHSLNLQWRRFCGNARREAYKRGLSVP